MRIIRNKIFLFLLTFSLVLGCSRSEDLIEKTTVYSNAYIAGYDKESNVVLVQPFGTYFSLTGYNKKDTEEKKLIFNDTIVRLHKLFDGKYYYKINNVSVNNLKVINDNYNNDVYLTIEEVLFNFI